MFQFWVFIFRVFSDRFQTTDRAQLQQKLRIFYPEMQW